MNKLENLGVSLAGGMTKIGLPVNIWEQPTNETSDMGNTTIVAIRAAINTLLTDNEHQIDPKLKWVLAIYQVVLILMTLENRSSKLKMFELKESE